MNAKSNFQKFLSVIALLSMLLTACAQAAATPAVVAVQENKQVYKDQSTQGKPQSAPTADQQTIPEAAAQPTAAVAAAPHVAPTQAPFENYAPTVTPAIGPTTVPSEAEDFFQQYGVNPFTDTSEDHLSTFSLDVDTASYTVMRNYVNGGSLPPADSVRVEEYVNYFNQGYPNPQDVAFGVYADGAPSPFSNDGTYLMRIGVQGYSVPEWERKPVVLTFVIDSSGSMGEQGRLEMVKQSLALLVDRLGPADSVAIVAYSTDAWTELNPTPGSDRGSIKNAIYNLRPRETTNVSAGLQLGYQLAIQAYQAGASNRVILASDGVANVGPTDADTILSFVHSKVAEGVTLTTIGVGMGDYNDALLEQLADKGNGNYAYVDTIDEARRVFVEDMVSTLQVIALDAKVQVDFNTDTVARYRLVGYENRAIADQDFRNDSVDAGEIGAGHTATAIYAVQFRPGAQGRIATVQLRWKDPQSYQVQEINGNFNTWDLAGNFDAASPRYRLAVLVSQYAELLRHSPYAKTSNLFTLSTYATRLSVELAEDQDVSEFSNLVARAATLEASGR